MLYTYALMCVFVHSQTHTHTHIDAYRYIEDSMNVRLATYSITTKAKLIWAVILFLSCFFTQWSGATT